jgi:hypothetical protein
MQGEIEGELRVRIVPHLTPQPPAALEEHEEGSHDDTDDDGVDVEGIDKLMGKELYVTVRQPLVCWHAARVRLVS